jgi:hypothetical protein
VGVVSTLIQIVAPRKARSGGTAIPPTFNPANTTTYLSVPQYQDHLEDIFTTRSADDSRALMSQLLDSDTDLSAAVHANLTMANVKPIILARDFDRNIDPVATQTLQQTIDLLTRRFDYSLGYQHKPSLAAICEWLRTMVMLRGGVMVEAVVDKKGAPAEIRNVDLANVLWYETAPGVLKPWQRAPGQGDGISLDLPGIFTATYRQNPTSIYPKSPFIAAINTLAARQQVINDLYRIMKVTGYPRMALKVLQDVLMKAAPLDVKADPAKVQKWMRDRLNEVAAHFEGISPDQAFVHFDSVEPTTINEKAPGIAIDIGPIIETLNAQNQAGLKTMSTVIGRGTSGVNTASVEARIAAMTADELNVPTADALNGAFSFFLALQGVQAYADIRFPECELRPRTELEPQLLAKSTRLRQDLSDGIITDEEYHLEIYGRLPPQGSKPLAGTGFMTPVPAAGDGTDGGSPGPLDRSLSPKGGTKPGRDNRVKKKPAQKS